MSATKKEDRNKKKDRMEEWEEKSGKRAYDRREKANEKKHEMRGYNIIADYQFIHVKKNNAD